MVHFFPLNNVPILQRRKHREEARGGEVACLMVELRNLTVTFCHTKECHIPIYKLWLRELSSLKDSVPDMHFFRDVPSRLQSELALLEAGSGLGSSFLDLDLCVFSGLLVLKVVWLQPVEAEVGVVDLLLVL